VRSATVDRLLSYLLDGVPSAADEVANDLAEWLSASSRFVSFADANRDKIRKKLRGATDAEARLDVRAELRVAYLLLADRHIELAFEAYGSPTGGPDFTVAYRGERNLNLEVTRQRRAPDAGYGGPLLAKLRQLPPSAPNVVLVAIEGDRADAFDVDGAVRGLRARADAKDEAFFTARGFRDTRAFYERFLRLGAGVVRGRDRRRPRQRMDEPVSADRRARARRMGLPGLPAGGLVEAEAARFRDDSAA
jgi:hypothetical protein